MSTRTLRFPMHSTTNYAICTTPGDGSDHLAALLTASGLAGTPRDYFTTDSFTRDGARRGARNHEEYVAGVLARRTAPSGAFGFVTSWADYRAFFADLDVRRFFSNLRPIVIECDDRLDQAIDAAWALAPDDFAAERIRALLEQIERERDAWAATFRAASLEPIVVRRRALDAGPAEAVEAVLDALGVARDGRLPTDAMRAPPGRAPRRAWRARFIALESPAAETPIPPPYAFALIEHTIPTRLPAPGVHGARLRVRNTGTAAWRAENPDAPAGFVRGDIALAVRVDGEWIDTRKLPRPVVAPGESVTIHFPLPIGTGPGPHRVELDWIEFDVGPFRDRGSEPIVLDIHGDERAATASDRLFAEAARVNPWFIQPTAGITASADGRAYPVFLARAKGCHVWDVEGNEYVDYMMANGSALLGHGDERVLEAIRDCIETTGPLLQMPHPLEIEVARMLTEDIPCAEMVTFGKNGSDACTVVARLARAFTGRKHIVYRGYHGWQDFWAEQAGFADTAIPRRDAPLMHVFRYNDLDDFLRVFEPVKHDLAAVMIEPSPWGGDQVGCEHDDPSFLATIADHARAAGALVIFDEIVTGYRVPEHSVQAATGVVPDLACAGKAIASGMPLAAAVGRADIMRACMPRVFYPGPTFRGEVYSLAAARATIEICRSEPVAAHVRDYGTRLRDEIHRLCREIGVDGTCTGPPFRMMFVFGERDPVRFRSMRTLLMQELLKHGVTTYLGILIPSYAHDDAAMDRTVEAMGAALERVADAARRDALEAGIEIPPSFF